MEISVVPLEDWPGLRKTGGQQKTSRFRATYIESKKLLLRELRHLQAKDVFLQMAVDRNAISIADNWLKANRRPVWSGIILMFKSKGRSLSFPCDTYRDWEDNLRAIALSFKALRMVDVYGVTRNSEQYRGWESLPSPNAEAVLSLEKCLAILADESGYPVEDIAEDMDVYILVRKKMLLKLHPDKGGNPEHYHTIQSVLKIVGESHGM